MDNGALCVQCVDYAQSHLSNAVHIPQDPADFDPDWEIDPKDLITLNKLGETKACLFRRTNYNVCFCNAVHVADKLHSLFKLALICFMSSLINSTNGAYCLWI